MSKRCPREGTRVTLDPTAAGMALYIEDGLRTGDKGSIVSVPLPGGRKTCFPGPRGGLVYVRWDKTRVAGVFRGDLRKASGGLLGGARRRAKRRKKR